MSGYVKTHRSVFTHDLFNGDEFSRREAWLWLISNAAWKPHKARHKNKMISIDRGQLPGGRAHLARVWGWSEKRVRNFLESLKTEGMIEVGTEKGQPWAIITVCNYSKFQSEDEKVGQQRASDGPAMGHTEEGKRIEEEEKKDSRELDLGVPEKVKPKSQLPVLEAYEAYNRTALVCGLSQASKLTPSRKQKIAARLKEHGVDGWTQALANIEKSEFLTGSTGFRADLDFMLKPANCLKLIEGGYGNGRHAKKPQGPITGRMISKDGRLIGCA